ncbi:MAG TPA: hypothetical protein VF516_42625 [Kofleriaceae bacterium]
MVSLLGRLLHVEVPGFQEARLADATLNELVPVEYRADAVVVFTEVKPEGKAEGEAAALLKILARRGFTLTTDQRRQVLECTDLGLLEQWLDRALSASSADELVTK